MRILKDFFFFLFCFLIFITTLYFFLPKGFLVVYFVNRNLNRFFFVKKAKFFFIPEKIKETFFGAEFKNVVLKVGGYKFNFKDIVWDGLSVYIPCKESGGYLKVKWEPLKRVCIEAENFKGICAGRKDFGKIEGGACFMYPKSFKGNFTLQNVNYLTPIQKVEIFLKSPYIYLKIPELNIYRKIEFSKNFY